MIKPAETNNQYNDFKKFKLSYVRFFLLKMSAHVMTRFKWNNEKLCKHSIDSYRFFLKNFICFSKSFVAKS